MFVMTRKKKSFLQNYGENKNISIQRYKGLEK
jgi:hypothetical protein